MRADRFNDLREFNADRARKLFKFLQENKEPKWNPSAKLAAAKILIMDEFALCSAIEMTLILTISQGVKNNFDSPFGGSGVLFVGDPLQGQAVTSDDTCLERESDGRSYLRR